MNLFFEKLLWPSLVLVLIELIFAHSQPHWFLATLAFAIMNVIAYVSISAVKRRSIAPATTVSKRWEAG